MNDESKQQNQPSLRRRGRALPWDKGVRLNWAQLGHLTIGQAERILREGSLDTHEGFLHLFAAIADVAGSETAQTISLLAGKVRDHAVGEEGTPDWIPFFAALKHERTTRAITEDMTLRDLSELLWEMHTAQDQAAMPSDASDRIRPESEA